MNGNQLQVFVTSIVPKGAKLYPALAPRYVLPSHTLEVLHILVFILIIAFYFIYAVGNENHK